MTTIADPIELELKAALKKGPADQDLRKRTLELMQTLQPDAEGARAAAWSYVKCCAMLAEITDHLGTHDQAGRAVTHAEYWFGQLRQNFGRLSHDEVIHTRECLRAYVVHAYVVVYRGGDRQEAIKRIQHGLDLMERLATVKVGPPGEERTHPMYGTRAQAHRYLADIFRTARRCHEAKAHLARSCEYVHKRFEYETQGADQDRIDAEYAFARHRLALCFLQTARIDNLEGTLHRGIEALVAVKALLLRWDDPITNATADLMQGIIGRNRVRQGRPDALAEAERLIRSALETFRRHHHTAKAMWAQYELGVLLIRAHVPELALQTFAQLDEEADPYLSQPGWLQLRARRLTCFAHCRRSDLARELRNDRSQALIWANRAVSCSSPEEWNLGRARIEALLARAAAYLMDRSRESLEEAEKDLTRAVELNTPRLGFDSRFAAIIEARRAQCCLGRDDLVGAESAWKAARRHAGATEHANMLALLDEVRKEIASARDKVVFRLDGDMTYDQAVQRLQRFLVKNARQRHRSVAEAAKQLEIGESTFYKWEKGGS